MQPTPDQPEESIRPAEIPYSDEAVLQGLIYPPPPSFYEHATAPKPIPAPPPLPQQAAATVPVRASVPASGTLFKPFGRRTPSWVWILIAALALLSVAGCALFGWSTVALFNVTNKQFSDAAAAVTGYYTELQERQYVTAYHAIDSQSNNNLTGTAFVQQALTIDRQYGPIQSFTLSTPAYDTTQNSEPSFGQMTITVHVKRVKQDYTASITLQQIQGAWKITKFDRI